MTYPKSDEAPLVIIVANEKGGQGKTLTSLAVADYASVYNSPLRVGQIDSQTRLASALGQKVLTVNAVPANARRDPGAEARIFTPLYTLLEEATCSGQNVLLDIGANQARRFSFWAGLVDLQEELDSWGAKTVLAVPLVAEAEGIRQASYTVGLIQEHLSNTHLIIIENEWDGSFSDLHPASDAAKAYQTEIDPLKQQAVAVLRMAAVEGAAWRNFEAASCRLVDVVGMPVDKVMELTGLPRPEAKIARGDVAAWAGDFFVELDRVLPWSQVGGDNA